MKQISRAAVLGAGTMGAAIAAHLANAGLTVQLLDAVPESLTPAETARGLTLASRAVRNRFALAGLDRVRTARPPAIFSAEVLQQISVGNVADDLAGLASADWIIEVVSERLDVKRALLDRIEEHRPPGAIVSTNTSGLPIGQIAEGRSGDFRAHFLGTHFFNPPRAMKLLEVTPIADTLPEVLETICRFGERDLGKGVVVCKDTPNFIGNRIFSFDLTFTLAYALEHGYTIEEVDLLTGPLIGRPRTATFRLLDLVGLDIMAAVGQNLYPRIPDDETRDLLQNQRSNALIAAMLERGWLGNKSSVGFYKESRTAEGRAYWPLDLRTLEHRPTQPPSFPSLAAIERERDLGTRLSALVAREDRAGSFIRAILGNLLGYASRRLPEIADDIRAVDDAMRWGFSHELGPFQVWDALGVAVGQQLAAEDSSGHAAAPWVEAMLATGRANFYAPDPTRSEASPSSWNVATGTPAPPKASPDMLDLTAKRASGGTIVENAAASLVDLGDGVAALELHSKMNTLDDRSIDLLHQSLDRVASDFVGLIVTGRGDNFSAGADIRMIASLVERGQLDQVDRVTKALQDAFIAVRFSPKPVVVTPFGWTLGGGSEFALSGARIVAGAESYLGQTEVGIGWIPGAGGCKELLRRVVSPVAALPQGDVAPLLERVFDLITQGKVSGSALEAREWGFLAPTDRIIMNRDHLLAAAKREVIALAVSGYRPPTRGKTVFAAGRDALAALKIRAYIFRQGGYASDHDVLLANQVAYVLCGGDLSEAQWVDEQYILNLERAAIRELCQQPKTLERIKHFLESGKILRN